MLSETAALPWFPNNESLFLLQIWKKEQSQQKQLWYMNCDTFSIWEILFQRVTCFLRKFSLAFFFSCESLKIVTTWQEENTFLTISATLIILEVEVLFADIMNKSLKLWSRNILRKNNYCISQTYEKYRFF